MPVTTIKINSEQRSGIYELLRNHIGSVGDLWDALEREEDYAKAEQLGLEFAEDLRLLVEIGWAKNDPRTEFELTMQPYDLIELLMRLHGEAALVLGGAEGSREDIETNRRFQRGYDACEEMLAALDPRAGERA